MAIRIEERDGVDLRDAVDPEGELLAPTSPGDVLRNEFLQPLEMSANALARELHVPANRVTGVLKGERRVTADTALRLARYFGTTARFWLGLQDQYDPHLARREVGERIEREVTPRAR